jgi:hypothetical protein
MSEQASAQDGLAGSQPGPSTYPGTPTSGGWIPVLAQASDRERPFVIDWICPSCNRLLAGSRTCPGCGLGLKISPRTRLPLPKTRRLYQYRKWSIDLFYGDDSLEPHSHKR